MFTTFDSTLLLMKGMLNYVNRTAKKTKKEIDEKYAVSDEQLLGLLQDEDIIMPIGDGTGALYVDKNDIVFLL